MGMGPLEWHKNNGRLIWIAKTKHSVFFILKKKKRRRYSPGILASTNTYITSDPKSLPLSLVFSH